MPMLLHFLEETRNFSMEKKKLNAMKVNNANLLGVCGVEHVSGDMFERVPSGGDAIFIKWVLHDWTDEECIKILRNCWKVLPEKGKVMVVEYILPVVPEPNLITQGIFTLDMVMMIQTGGKERTRQEFEALAKEAGFTGLKATYISMYVWLMEFTK
ncbi:hypothetical protein OPV22_028476 [Ensete ventricosum]|uniref:O-methyltransferase C-terminal domain-containing protein n=2 Tax=Ensete ventricosum TaxID=4639 RepID=A0AAV8QAP5_ENSVE|nr:hypothetical protein OPV22_028476 [Ensete ventricosum]